MYPRPFHRWRYQDFQLAHPQEESAVWAQSPAQSPRVAVRRQTSGREDASSGGQGQPINISNQLSDLAVRATKALELDVAGVDLLETHNMIADTEYVVLEVNPSPGLEEIEAVTKINVAEAIITYAETIGDR